MFENLFTSTSFWIGFAHLGLLQMYWSQVLLTFRRKSVSDISLKSLSWRMWSGFGFIMAAISIANPVMLAADSVLTLLGAAQIAQKLHYDGFFRRRLASLK